MFIFLLLLLFFFLRNFFLLLLVILLVIYYIYKCKDLIWLESKTGMDPGPHSPNNEFIECRKENQFDLGPKILDFSVKRLKTQASNVARSLFGQALEIWFLLFFSLFPFLCLSSSYILWFFCLFYHPRVDLAFNVLFRHPPCPLLNLPFLAGKLFVHCSGITSTLMRPGG